jgi:hypothetical protein
MRTIMQGMIVLIYWVGAHAPRSPSSPHSSGPIFPAAGLNKPLAGAVSSSGLIVSPGSTAVCRTTREAAEKTRDSAAAAEAAVT